MTALRQGVVRRGGARRADGESREEMEAQRVAAAEREKKTVRVNEFITVSELAQILKIPATQIVGFAFKNLGLMVTINQRLDFDQIELIAGEFGFAAVKEEEYTAGLEESGITDTPEGLKLQAEGHDVRYRNAWIKELDLKDANTDFIEKATTAPR